MAGAYLEYQHAGGYLLEGISAGSFSQPVFGKKAYGKAGGQLDSGARRCLLSASSRFQKHLSTLSITCLQHQHSGRRSEVIYAVAACIAAGQHNVRQRQ